MRIVRFVFSRLFFCMLVIAALLTAIIFLCVYIRSVLPAALGAALAYAISVIAAIKLFCSDMQTDGKCAWLAVIAALPVAGVLLYAIACTGASEKKFCGSLPAASYTEHEYYADGAQYLQRLKESVSHAKKRVYLEYYIISKGHIWDGMCSELEKALDRHVEVKIIYDGWGSVLKAPKKDFARLKKRGAQIKIFNRLMPFPLSRLNARDHRKIAAIDGRAVFLGGVNIADEYANISSPHGYWKDGGVMLKGHVAKVYEAFFLSVFGNAKFSSPENNGESGTPVLPVADSPELKTDGCENLIAAQIYAAQRRVLIFTPYLCVGEKLKDALSFAAARGVEVKIVVPAIPDKKLTYEITKTFCAELAGRGVKIYRYTPGFMHAKCVICDDEALIGSYNFDFRSLRLNYECGVWAGGALAADAAKDFYNTLPLCAELNEKKPSALRRAARGALKLFAPLF